MKAKKVEINWNPDLSIYTSEPFLKANGSKAESLRYVLITPARNEEEFIEQTIKSVIGQTVLPIRWVIVSDGSTDATNDIVKKYANAHKWIEFVLMPERKERHFAGKVHAFNAGYAKVKDLTYDIVGSLDADISFDPEYFDFMLRRRILSHTFFVLIFQVSSDVLILFAESGSQESEYYAQQWQEPRIV